ncbi:hypothetical protein [Eleftheria terrae]|uniref:hypothetical protein n=1 Tax=Eleftheria terrae TaxID=1597781 RepID=UPI00263B9A73|nr:hypothetical protein [Eleftheria terrae]WKB52316.1 hypothetical protein N7L95_21370 [Eleftheria terrae]
MRTLTPAAHAALSSGRVVIAQLIYLGLSQPVYLNTTGWDLQWNGSTWRGAAGIGSIDVIEDSPGEIKGLSLELSAVHASDIALALAEPLQGRPVEIRTAIFDPDSLQVLDAPVEWAGRLDTAALAESGGAARMAVTAEHIGIDLLRSTVMRYSDAEQRRLFPGDRGLEYVSDQAEQNIVWPAASFHRR